MPFVLFNLTLFSDVHETFQAETETRPRRWAFWSRRDRDETRDAEVRDRDKTFCIRDETETETLQLPRP